MALETVNNVEISLKDYSTQSVTLGHERATIVREIAGVDIKPGPNKVTIYGFDPLVGADSVRVSGRGPATITDIQTEIIPQKEQLEVFSDDESESDDSDSVEPSDSELGLDRSELKRVEDELKDLRSRWTAADGDEAAAARCLQILDSYGNTLRAQDNTPGTVEDYLRMYKGERAELSRKYDQAVTIKKELDPKIHSLLLEGQLLSRAFNKAKRAATKVHRRQRAERLKSRQLKTAERRKLRDEKAKFHPFNVGQLVVHLDGFSESSQKPSRRNSMGSTSKPDPKDQRPETETLSLSLTYVVPQATWAPRYEVFLETPSASGQVVYRAEYHNWTSETWENTKLVFSNSQTSFSGMNELIPVLQSWNVKLLNDTAPTTNPNTKGHWKHGLGNQAEARALFGQKAPPKDFGGGKATFGNAAAKPTGQTTQQGPAGAGSALFGKPTQGANTSNLFGGTNASTATSGGGLFGNPNAAPATNTASPFGSTNVPAASNTGGLFGGATATNTSAFGNPPRAAGDNMNDQGTGAGEAAQQSESEHEDASGDDDSDSEESINATLTDASNELAFQESSRHDYGLTTTYEVSGRRTLQPSTLKRRHIIAELNLASITYSHVVVPKLRPAAFLKAQFMNSSSTSFLRGKAGLTLDGTFLGTTTIPNCSSNGGFSLSLGVDPAILVNYAKPKVRRATTGFFNKEDCAIFTRVCRVVNTKSNSVSVAVFDQVPVSEDERLRIRVLQPRGIEKSGDSANIGSEVSKRAWGKGTVSMGGNGGIKWEMTLDKGAEVTLSLEYEARIPTGQKMVGLD